MRAIEPGKRLVRKKSVYQQEKLPTDKKVGQYVRQSSVQQTKKHRSSTVNQDADMRELLIDMGWKDEDIIKFDKDQGKSGQKRIDERVDMNDLYRRIEAGEIGAVACFDPSRLFRDLTRRQYMTFIFLCQDHHIPIITWDQVYWTSNRRESKALIEKFEEAANYIDEFIIGKLHPAKHRTIEKDKSYGGHAIPIGFLLAEEEIEDERIRKYYIPYEPHARLVRWLFKRYRELGGNLGRLFHELQVTGFSFPPFPKDMKKPHVALKKNEDGSYSIRFRHGLVTLLSNASYLGWYVYDGMIVSKEAHTAIVDYDDFIFAFNRLSKTTLDGVPNEHKPPLNRRSYRTERKGLLENVLRSNGSPAYAMMGKGIYITGKRGCTGDSTEINVPIKLLDRDFSVAIRFLLSELEARHQAGLKDNLYDRLVEAQENKAAQTVSYKRQHATIDKSIREWEIAKRAAMAEEYEPGVQEATRELKKAHAEKAELQEKERQAGSEQAELEKCKTLLDIALHKWESLSFEEKRRFVRLLVRVVDIREASPHILKLDISLHEPFAYSLDGYIFRHKGAKTPWTEEELTELRRLYPRADRIDLLKALKRRSWESIIAQAGLMKLKRLRPRVKNDTGIHDALAYTDARLMHSLGMDTNIVPWEQDTQEDPVIAVGPEYVPLHTLLTSEEVQYKAGLGPIPEPEPAPEPDLTEWPEQVPAPEPEDDDEDTSVPGKWTHPYILIKREISIPNKYFLGSSSQRAVAEFPSGRWSN